MEPLADLEDYSHTAAEVRTLPFRLSLISLGRSDRCRVDGLSVIPPQVTSSTQFIPAFPGHTY